MVPSQQAGSVGLDRAPRRTRGVSRAGRALGIAAGLSLTLSAITAGQGGSWGAVFPAASTLGPPDWVRPGTRIVYYVASASVAQSRYQYVQEPCQPNSTQFTNKVTGLCYRRTDESGEGVGSGSGSGYSVVDVVSVDGRRVVTAVSLYGIDTALGTLTYLPIGGSDEPGGAVDSVWLHPQLLEGLLAGQGLPGGLEPLEGVYPLDGVPYHVVALQGGGDSVTFDRATGLVLMNTGGAVGSTLQVHLPGEDPSLGNRMLTYQKLLGVRDRAVPGTGARVPPWLVPGTTLVFQGTFSGGTVVPAQTTITYDQVGPDWASLGAVLETTYGQGSSRDEARVVSGGAGPFWYDTDALAGMEQGAILDSDPITGVLTHVEEVGSWERGEYVVIVTEGTGTRFRFIYDRATGVPLGYDLAQGVGVTSVRLTAMPPGT